MFEVVWEAPPRLSNAKGGAMWTMRNLLVAAVVWAAASVTAAHAEIMVGVAGPMSGQYSWFGEQMERGAELAVDDLNAAGGVLGEEVVLIVGDDACDPEQAMAVANPLPKALLLSPDIGVQARRS